MTPGQLRPIGYERSAAKHRPLPPRPSKDNRCRDCPGRDSVKRRMPASRDISPKKQEFAPTRNRFSILAELDQNPSQTKWAFDFVQTPRGSFRRRGKRGGKNTKIKYDKRQQGNLGNESIEELCRRIAAFSTTGDNSTAGGNQEPVQQVQATYCAEDVRHHWMPQYRPNSDTTLPRPACTQKKSVDEAKIAFTESRKRTLLKANDGTIAQQLTKHKRKESRFFPLSAFLATPDSIPQSVSPHSPAPTHTKVGAPKKLLLLANPSSTTAQIAAASAAFRALQARKETLTSSEMRLGPRVANRESDSSVPAPSTSESSRTASSSPIIFPLSPLQITPPLAAIPTLTTVPVIPSLPPTISSSSIVSTFPSPSSEFIRTTPFVSRPRPTAGDNSTLQDWSPLGWQAALTSDSPLSLSPFPTSPVCSPIVTKQDGPLPLLRPGTLPSIAGCSPGPFSSTGTKTEQELHAFLQLGHASPCWCTTHGTGQQDGCVHACEWAKTPGQLAVPPVEKEVEDANKSEPTDSDMDSILLTPSSTSSGFEDLGLIRDDEDNEWLLLTPSERYGRPARPRSVASSDSEDFDDILSSAFDSSTPSDFGSPVVTPSLLLSSTSASTFRSPISPVGPLSAALPSPPPTPGQSSSGPEFLGPSPWSEPVLTCLPREALGQTQATGEEEAGNASAVEWPTLREPMGMEMRKKRHRAQGSSSSSCGWKWKHGIYDQRDQPI